MNDKSLLFLGEPEERIRAAARQYLGEKLVSAELISGGLFNTTYRLETEKGKRILRLGPMNRHLLLPYEQGLMAAEGDILNLLKEQGIPTSDILALDLSRTLFDRDVMIVDCLDAKSMSMVELPKDAEERICREVGAFTVQIHRIHANALPGLSEKPFGRYANVISGNGGATWKEALLLELEQWSVQVLRADIFSSSEVDEVFAHFRKYAWVLDAITEPYLVHGDLWYGNVLVDQDQNLRAIIDGDRAMFGDPEFELATGWIISDAFLEGYGKGLEEHPDAVLRRKLYKLLLNLEDCYILFCEYSSPEEGSKLKQRILDEIRTNG